MSMTAAEARSEIKQLFQQCEAIENRYPDGPITDVEDEKQVKALLATIDDLETKLGPLPVTFVSTARELPSYMRTSVPAQRHLPLLAWPLKKGMTCQESISLRG